MKLLPPTSYQGAKNRIAHLIVDKLLDQNNTKYYDLCCGSGAITLELINRGVVPQNITMCDAGPWGLFWKEISEGKFDLDLLKKEISQLPDIENIKDYIVKLSRLPAAINTSQIFLLLQASSFGSKPIWIENKSWKNCSFRSYWKPTATSNRKSPVNPMMPMPETILERATAISKVCGGLNVIYGNIEEVKPEENATVYIDPPYRKTTPYGWDFDVVKYALSVNQCFVSEGYAIPEAQESLKLIDANTRKKGGINGKRQINPNEEYLNIFKKGN